MFKWGKKAKKRKLPIREGTGSIPRILRKGFTLFKLFPERLVFGSVSTI